MEKYEKAYEYIKKRKKSILKDIRSDLNHILVKLYEAVELMRNNEEQQLQEFSRPIEARLEQLISLDLSCGSQKRKCAMILNHNVQQAFGKLRSDIVPKVTRIEEMLKNLESDLLICIGRVESLMSSCQKCKNYLELAKSTEENEYNAKQILDQTATHALIRLNEIETYKRNTLQYHETMMNQITKKHREKNKDFLEQLDKCILAVKNKK